MAFFFISLQELSDQTGLSRAALGNYETDDYKEITHKAIVILADFYGVSSDYLLGLTENREHHSFPVDELGLDDTTIDLIKSGKLNVRLICEMIKHPEFTNFLSDLEIYVDNLAGMQIRNMNTMIEQTRLRLQNNGIPDSDHYMKTLVAASINEDNYFNNLLGNDIAKIAKDLRATQAQMIMYSKLFKINFTEMDPYEFKTFTDILQRYSDLCKPVKGNGRGRKKKIITRRRLVRENSRNSFSDEKRRTNTCH